MSAEDRPSDALTALGEAAFAEARRVDAGRPDWHVGIAFALGWQMAEIYRPEREEPVPGDDEDHLPGITDLDDDEWARVGLYQVQAGITRLRHAICAAGLLVPNAELFADGLEGRTGAAREAAVVRFHVEILAMLTAADYRLGKGYALGRALADMTRAPADLGTALATARVRILTAWMRDLTTALPAHAGHVVAGSLENWGIYAQLPGSPTSSELDRSLLQAQGRLWRSLISGEKRATDMLQTADYVAAGEVLLQNTATLVRPIVRHHAPVLIAGAVLFVIGIVIMLVTNSAGGIVSGAGFILTSIGVGWKGVGSSAGKALAKLETPVWESALDTVIRRRITPQRVLDAIGPREAVPDEPSLVAATRRAEAR